MRRGALVIKRQCRDFPGGPVVMTPRGRVGGMG